eukprot:TRINITY_DN111287_c0_g1_i1.p1 TRINITY_DN111287_c0_g1~~TRINITY_DN111287_c0_g1_i1.p1  ORF type:complete len:270 (+),score=50.38 TRINITY_DN111287_c0_g1_i1:38-811(+)
MSCRDPRTLSRHYAWRFDTEPGVPNDKYRVPRAGTLMDKEVRIMRPILGPARHCPCCCKPAEVASRSRLRSRVSSSATEAGDSAGSIFCEGSSFEVGSSSSAADGADTALGQEVRRELTSRFGIAGSLDFLASPDGPSSHTRERMATAKAAARHLLNRRCFEVRIIDASKAGENDGIAKAAQKRATKKASIIAMPFSEAIGPDARVSFQDVDSSEDIDAVDKYHRSVSSYDDDDDSDDYFGPEEEDEEESEAEKESQ